MENGMKANMYDVGVEKVYLHYNKLREALPRIKLTT